MRVVRTEQPGFKPVRMEIVFETKAELDAFTTIFNTTSIVDSVTEVFGLSLSNFNEVLYEEATRLGGDGTNGKPNAVSDLLAKHPSIAGKVEI